ncbi:hypothetical protein KA005_62100 [bacterium]|nr:hypothetical protein [bacterium]
MDKESTILFPLRTNVNYFRSNKEYLDLQSRVKQSLILFDNVLFQAGEYHCLVGPDGVIQNYQSHYKQNRGKKPVKLEGDNKDTKRFWLKIRTSATGPSKPFTTIIASELQRSFRSQFHTLVDEIRKSGINNVELRYYEFPDEINQKVKQISKDESKKLEFEKENYFLKNTIINNLNKDLLLMAILELPASIDSLHAPLVQQKAKRDSRLRNIPGYLSLHAWVPYVGNLTWEEISEFRSHPAVINFRERLKEAENKARLMLGETSQEDIQEELSNILTDELLKEIQHLRPSTKELALDVGKDVSVNLLGAIFPPIGALLEVANLASKIPEINEIKDQKKSWVAALMDLRLR